MEEEIWIDIKEYEGHYMVSNLGRVKSLDRYTHRKDGQLCHTKERILVIQYNKRNNIYMVMLNLDGKRKAINLHRLVALNFIDNDDIINKLTVNHKDGDRSNNKVSNLEWDTYSGNLQHAYDELNRPVCRASALKRPCKSINKETEETSYYESIAQASRDTNVSETQIRRLIALECVNEFYYFQYT